MSVEAKICGINSAEAMNAAVANGAAYVGLVFYPPSPRALTAERAAALADLAPPGVIRVGLFVDMDDDGFRHIVSTVKLDLLQLHGRETPERVAAIKALTRLPAMKAIKVGAPEDVHAAFPFVGVADRLLFDAKTPPEMTGALPGGNAVSFDWRILGKRNWPCPWMLSGGLDAGNVAEAVRISGAKAVDVSSGVEIRPGVKDAAKIAAFLAAVKAL